MTPTLTVHRGSDQIGGSCIEIAAAGGERLILDAGRPLDAAKEATGLLPTSLDRSRPATVLFSHAHQDHWGLIDELPRDWPVRTGGRSAELMRLSAAMGGKPLDRPIRTWGGRARPFAIGPFTVTPYLTDHSAPDAYMLLIEVGGTRLLYSGDFRAHGRKRRLVEAMIAAPPAGVDVLVMEGTNLGQSKPAVTEDALETEVVALARATRRHVFAYWSAQNLDRTTTLFRAARRTGRDLVIDLYAADVTGRIAPGTRLPRPGPGFPELKVVILPSGHRYAARQGRGDWARTMATSPFARARHQLRRPAIIMLRDSMLGEMARGGLGFTPDDAYLFSAWSGYLDPADPDTGWARATAAGATTHRIHTSGHASPADLARFAAAIAPRFVVPVHGASWDAPGIDLPPVRRLADGEAWTIPAV